MTADTDTAVTEPELVVEPTVETPKVETPKRKAPVIRDHEDAILSLRAENEGLRKKLDEASDVKAKELAEEHIKKARQEAVDAAEKKLEARLAELDTANKQRLVKSELKAAAIRAGVIDFADLYAIMQGDLSKIEFGDDGEVTNAHKLVADVKVKKSHLFGGVSTTSEVRPPPAREQANEKSALEMTPAEYRTAKARLIRM